ncbi:uncharacterized protein EAE97_006943 [Botrytis byssoidea]|uniref:Uncharacterized protein n=1 Tax=Botrytis byssoidea TaxID=139641 RepID=A0A9P5IN22_9HELO|nr:uncharacterized protein EAE97_006943 [Botrytis byssoidea]KAF7940757.1 hypothetical protein EAE97_006943 [Botrytis byssoidea]
MLQNQLQCGSIPVFHQNPDDLIDTQRLKAKQKPSWRYVTAMYRLINQTMVWNIALRPKNTPRISVKLDVQLLLTPVYFTWLPRIANIGNIEIIIKLVLCFIPEGIDASTRENVNE